MIQLVKPRLQDLSFRQALLSDAPTMAYNDRWGGVIDFPPDRWEGWYQRWVACPDKRFYRFLYSPDENAFVGEIAWHFDEAYSRYLCDVIVKSCYRGKGYGREGLTLLLNAAKEQGLSLLCDNIAVDNPAISLFQRCGFTEAWRNDEIIMLEKQL